MNIGKLTADDFILVGQGRGAAILRIGDISLIEVEGNDLTLRCNGGERFTSRCSLARCIQRLPGQFFAAGRKCMVNLAEVAKVNPATRSFEFTMKDGTLVPVSRKQSRALRKGFAL
jgi:DNA-binding LytR/AlgR family response regulator